MKKISALWGAVNALAQRLGLRKPVVMTPPTEYQQHVAQKAKELLELMEAAAQDNNYMADMVSGMKTFLEDAIACKVTLPSRGLNGWIWYFLYENPERLDIKFPEICLAQAHLGHLMDFDSFEKLHAAENRIKNMRK